MPVIECDCAESAAMNAILKVDMFTEIALFDRSQRLKSIGWWERAQDLFAASMTRKKRSLCGWIARSRMLPNGERARLADPFWVLRDPLGEDPDALLIAWGDVWEGLGEGRVSLRAYEPLPRYLEPEELERALRYASQARPRLVPLSDQEDPLWTTTSTTA